MTHLFVACHDRDTCNPRGEASQTRSRTTASTPGPFKFRSLRGPEISDDGRTPVNGLCESYDQISPSTPKHGLLSKGERSACPQMRVTTVGIPLFLGSQGLVSLVLWSATSTLDGFDTRLRPRKLITRVPIVSPPNHIPYPCWPCSKNLQCCRCPTGKLTHVCRSIHELAIDSGCSSPRPYHHHRSNLIPTGTRDFNRIKRVAVIACASGANQIPYCFLSYLTGHGD